MMNNAQKERYNMFMKYAGKVENETFLKNWYNTFAENYVDELLKNIECDMNDGLILSKLLAQLEQLHTQAEVKDELVYCSVVLLGFTEDEEIKNFMQEEKEYMQIVEEEFEEIYQETIADQECLMDMFTDELHERVANALFTDAERQEMINSIKSIVEKGEPSSYSIETKFPLTIEEWCFLIPTEDMEIETTAKLLIQTESVFTAVRNLVFDYLKTDEGKELPHYKICNIEHSVHARGRKWIHMMGM